MKTLSVVVGIIKNQQGQILISGRNTKDYLRDEWEFPGGKIKNNETEIVALKRELFEELNLTIQTPKKLLNTYFQYPKMLVFVKAYLIINYSDDLMAKERQKIKWSSDLAQEKMLATSSAIINALFLPDRYLISPPNKNLSFLTHLLSTYNNLIVQYRDPDINNEVYIKNARVLIKVAHDNQHKILLNCEPVLAQKLKADGVHLNGKRLINIVKNPNILTSELRNKLIIAASCHNISSVMNASDLGLDFVVLSPIRSTESHPELVHPNQFLGWRGFELLAQKCAVPSYALGGVGLDEILIAKEFGGQGVAGISAFMEKSNENA